MRVLEIAQLKVKPGQSGQFKEAFSTATEYIHQAEGCVKVDWYQSAEHADHFVLLVEWRSLEDHIERFVSSPEFGLFQQAIWEQLAEEPEVEHFLL